MVPDELDQLRILRRQQAAYLVDVHHILADLLRGDFLEKRFSPSGTLRHKLDGLGLLIGRELCVETEHHFGDPRIAELGKPAENLTAIGRHLEIRSRKQTRHNLLQRSGTAGHQRVERQQSLAFLAVASGNDGDGLNLTFLAERHREKGSLHRHRHAVELLFQDRDKAFL